MDGQRFDQITKALATGASRRRLLKGLAGGAAGGLAAMFGAKRADAACRQIRHPCEGTQQCCPGLECVQAAFEGQSERCCPPGNEACGTGCCPIGQCCRQGNQEVCLAAGQCCTAADCPTPTNQCAVAACTNGVCGESAKPNGTPCDDNNACTTGEACQNGACTGGTATVCTASDQCHVAGTCDPATGACSNPAAPDGTPCNDNDACTQTDTCQGGACTGSNPVVCTAQDQCHRAGTCDPATGACSNPVNVGASCNDNNACTTGETCQADGSCGGGTQTVCQPLDQCHLAGTCDPATGACSNPVDVGAPCNDQLFCTTGETCQADGTCGGGTPTCNPAQCLTCDEASDMCIGCPTGQECKSGQCVPICPHSRPVFCVTPKGQGFKCCPADECCNYQPDGTVTCGVAGTCPPAT